MKKVKVVKMFKTSVDKWRESVPSVFKLLPGYVSDQLKDVFYYWNKYRAVILNLPTGAGKTTFVVYNLITYAIKNNMRVVIVSNRIALDLDIKKRIAELQGMYNGYPDEIIRDTDDFGLITITTYQRLPKYLRDDEFCKRIRYFVADEVHFFTSDALFNNKTEYILYKMVKAFKDAVRIYLSATIEDVLPYICAAECSSSAIERWRTRFLYDKIQQEYTNNYNYWWCCGLYKPLTELITSDYMDGKEIPVPIIYEQKMDNGHMDIKCYSDSDVVPETINRSSNKSMVFVDSKKRGQELKDALESASYMTAEKNNNDPRLLHDIISNETFPEKTLITTSVFGNGCNINDDRVTDVFIENIDRTDIIQMVGRRRKTSNTDRFTVYIRIPDPELLDYYISSNNEKIDLIEEAKANTDKFLNELANEAPDAKKLKGLYYISDGKPVFNQIAIDMLHKNSWYYATIKEMIETKGEDEYCKEITKLFCKKFSHEMIIKPHDYKQDTIQWLESLAGQEIDLEDFEDRLKSYIKKFNPKSRERSDRKLGLNALNRRLSSNDLPFELVKKEGAVFLEEL